MKRILVDTSVWSLALRKKDTVNAALDEFIKRRKARDLIDIFGTIEYEASYDYKKMRSR